ncbi:MAG: hypothetical protein U5J83_14105 [Bryobacterales bacterium]|nr:hypothetical protein [Bryobacterales bacterium]
MTLRTSYREFPPPYSGRTVLRGLVQDGGRKRGIWWLPTMDDAILRG